MSCSAPAGGVTGLMEPVGNLGKAPTSPAVPCLPNIPSPPAQGGELQGQSPGEGEGGSERELQPGCHQLGVVAAAGLRLNLVPKRDQQARAGAAPSALLPGICLFLRSAPPLLTELGVRAAA